MTGTTRSAIARSNQAYYSQIAETESLDWGIAYWSKDFPDLEIANQFREVIVDSDSAMIEAYESAERHFQSRGLQCRRWAPSVESDPALLADFLGSRGFEATSQNAMLLEHWPDIAPNDDIRILPARAMRDAYRATHCDAQLAAPDDPQRAAEAALERLDNAAMDMFVATIDRKPVAHGGLFLVGDIARILDVAVLPEWRRQGVGRELMRHILTLAHRLAPRIVCTEIERADAEGRLFLESLGFVVDGTSMEFRRPAAAAAHS